MASAAGVALLAGCMLRPSSKTSETETSLPFVHAQGTRFVDPAGNPITLRGCNLGNWLLLEMWMLDLKTKGLADQHAYEAVLDERFGPERRFHLMEVYREHFITPRDFQIIRSFGFNVVRVPFDHALLEDDARPMQLRPDALRWLDRAVDMARAAGLYVILDLHGAPGRQSLDHTTGWSGQNRLWTDAACQERTVWLWTELAKHYRDVAVVAGYDLVNEPFGDMRTPRHEPALAALADRLHAAIRSVDTNHVIFVPGTMSGIEFYGEPKASGWSNVAFTEHYYPGLFGSPSTLDTHARFIGQRIPDKADYLQRMEMPLLVGEFNVVLKELKAPALMRRYYDEYAAQGWAATMWTYKLLRRRGGADGWAMVCNQDPLPDVDVRDSSYEEIASYFASLGNMPLVVNEALRTQLTSATPDGVELRQFEWLETPPAEDAFPGWRTDDVNGSLRGGQRVLEPDALEVYGGGTDIWSDNDQFRFIWQQRTGDVSIAARVDALMDTEKHAKAGVMLRNSLAPDSAHVLLHIIPSGKLCLGWRPADGSAMEEIEIAQVNLPVHVRLERKNGEIRGRYSTNGSDWVPVAMTEPVQLKPDVGAGLAVLAHYANHSLTRATFRQIELAP